MLILSVHQQECSSLNIAACGGQCLKKKKEFIWTPVLHWLLVPPTFSEPVNTKTTCGKKYFICIGSTRSVIYTVDMVFRVFPEFLDITQLFNDLSKTSEVLGHLVRRMFHTPVYNVQYITAYCRPRGINNIARVYGLCTVRLRLVFSEPHSPPHSFFLCWNLKWIFSLYLPNSSQLWPTV